MTVAGEDGQKINGSVANRKNVYEPAMVTCQSEILDAEEKNKQSFASEVTRVGTEVPSRGDFPAA